MNERLSSSASLLDRLLFLSDGVFAIAITLLVLEIGLPHLTGGYQSEGNKLTGALFGIWPQILTYALSFVIIGVYWISHQRLFQYLTRADNILAWLNVFFLMSVAFLPIPSNILGEYGDHGPAVRFYAVSLMVPGIWMILLWLYATYHHRLVEKDLDPGIIRHRLERSLIAPAVFLLTIALSYFNPYLAEASLLLVLVGVVAHERRRNRLLQSAPGIQSNPHGVT
jgi:uncharacterized membrane protein